MSESQAPPLLHSVPSAVKRLGVNRTMVFGLMKSGQLRSVKIGKRRFISEAALVEFVNAAEGVGA